MQRKFTKSLLATAILFGLTACGSSGGGGSSEPTTKVNTAVETIKPSTTKPSGTSTNTTKPNNTGEATSTTSGNAVKPNNTGTTTPAAVNTDKQETITVPTVGNDSENTTANLTNANDIQNEIKKSIFKLDNLGNPTGNAIYTSDDGIIVLKANFDDRLISGNINAFLVEYEYWGKDSYSLRNSQGVKYLNMNYKNVKPFDISVDLQETSLYQFNGGYKFSGDATGKSNHPEYSQLEGIYDGTIISNKGYSSGFVNIRLSDKISINPNIYRQ